jgi:1-phosphofructokinase family hexose kinase
MITTVTLNPMLDKTVAVDAVRRGGVSRASGVSMVVGGKGVNVSRQLRMLGEETVATGFIGGETGSTLERLLDGEGIPHRFVRISGMTREGVTYLEPDGTMTSVFEPSHPVTPREAERLLEECRMLAGKSDWIVCSGSSPGPAADDVFRMIVADCRSRGIPVVLDSYGRALARGVESGPDFLKPNREEFEQTFGTRLSGESDMIAAARRLVARGVRYSLITDGPRPFAAACGDEAWIVTPPVVESVNPTGSGDSMIAGILHGLSRSWPFPDCLGFGAAAGAANARVREVAHASREEIQSLLPGVTVRRIQAPPQPDQVANE